MSALLVILLVASAKMGVWVYATPTPGELGTTLLDLGAKIYGTIEEANRPSSACFEMYEDSKYRGTKSIICGQKGKCIELPSSVSTSVSSIKFVNDGRFFAVEKLRVYKMESCTLYLDSDGYDEYGSSNLVWNDGYHNCDGYDLFSDSCDKSFNDNINSIRFY